MSCHFAVPVNGLAVVLPEIHCVYLGRQPSGLYHCTVYPERFEKAPWCHTAESALAAGFLAKDCPYAKGVANYRGKVQLSRSLLQAVKPAIIQEILRVGVPIGADPEAVLALFETTGKTFFYRKSDDGTRYLFFQEPL